jgi:hypothetical protein
MAMPFDLCYHFIGFVFTAIVGNNYIVALFGQGDCCVFSESAATAGDQCDLVSTCHIFFDYFDLQGKDHHDRRGAYGDYISKNGDHLRFLLLTSIITGFSTPV